MTNYGLEIYLNDNYVCRAGFESKHYVLTCIVNALRRASGKSEELFLQVSGLNSDTGQYVDWAKMELKNGDNISIQVVSDNFDKPVHIRGTDSQEAILKKKIERYYALKEELKDHLPNLD